MSEAETSGRFLPVRVVVTAGATAGSKRLCLLGIIALAVTLVMTTVSMLIYYYSGDIYIDRSRPDFLPDKTEKKADEAYRQTNYSLPEAEGVSQELLEEYLRNLQQKTEPLEQLRNPFAAESLSDQSLGIEGANEEGV